MNDIRYYIIYPGGRQKITAENDLDAVKEFNEHWTATAAYFVAKPTRRLIKEIRTEVALEALKWEHKSPTPTKDT